MNIVPILVDVTPEYLAGPTLSASLLALPYGLDTLRTAIDRHLGELTPHKSQVLSLGEGSPVVGGEVQGGVHGRELLRDPLAHFHPSDVLLLISSRFVPVGGFDLAHFVESARQDAHTVRHLLVADVSASGTKEFVHPGSRGGVRRIQRYFGPTAWPFTTGVMASLVPVASLLAASVDAVESLEELRQQLSASGVPSSDERFGSNVFDLIDEAGALAMNEARVNALTAARSSKRRRSRGKRRVQNGTVHPTARLMGPVAVGAGAEIGEGALVVGPTLIGAGARVGVGARVAQCLVTAGSTVGDGQTVRHRVVHALAPTAAQSQARVHTPPPHRRQAHPTVLREQHAAPAVASRVRSYGEWKSWVEAVVAAVMLIVFLPLFVVLGILVKLTSPGPVFYGAVREGLDGRVFRCWKFRSMRVNADAMQRALAEAQFADGPQFKIEKDPRITPIGGWLRSWNLDELPQLANVVLRQMSFVGPRPSPFEENQICVPWRDGRLSVRPGITGLWQVCRRDRAEGDFHQWILYDLLYVAHASFWVDIRIFIATIVTLGGRTPADLHRIIPHAVPSEIEALVDEEFTAGRVSAPPTIALTSAAGRRLARSVQRTPRTLHSVKETL